MQCHECGRAVQVGDRFCTGCGISLAGVTEPTGVIPSLDADTTGAPTTEHPTAANPTAEAPPTEHPTAANPTVDAPAAEAPTTANPTAGAPTAGAPAAEAPTTANPTAEHPTAGTTTAPGAADPDAETATSELPSTELIEQVEDDGWGDDDPLWAATGTLPETAAPAVGTGDLPMTEPITEVWMDPVSAPAADETAATPATPLADAPATAAMPVTPAPADVGPAIPDHRFRFSIVTLLGLIGGLTILVAVFATVVEITSTNPITIDGDAPAAFRLGTWIADDLAGNLSIAGLFAALAMVLGGVASAFGWRWGSGLAGGGGLATAGLAALVIGLAQFPIDAAHEFAAIPTDQQFTLTITKALGYWLLVAAGAIGVVVFFASTNDAFGDRRDGLNPWIAALGALAVVIATAGPLLPEGTAVFSDNWYVVERPGEPPAMLVAMRLVQLGLFALGGVVGFLSVRRWGLGVAVGATLPAVWLGVSTLFEIGDDPVGPGYRNPGASNGALHGVTIIGLSAILGMAVLGAVAAYDQSVRARR